MMPPMEPHRENHHHELVRLARKVCDSDKLILVAIEHVAHPEAVTFHRDSERTITVHGSAVANDRRKYMVLLYRYDGERAPGHAMSVPEHEVLERAGTILLEEAQRMRKESGW